MLSGRFQNIGKLYFVRREYVCQEISIVYRKMASTMVGSMALSLILFVYDSCIYLINYLIKYMFN